MSTLYWIAVLGNVSFTFFLLLLVFFLSSFVLTVFMCDKSLPMYHNLKRIWKISLTGFIISLTVEIMVPSKDDLYAIYGVGSVIDYAKGSKEVQKFPDNAVKALNVWLENIQERDSTSKVK